MKDASTIITEEESQIVLTEEERLRNEEVADMKYILSRPEGLRFVSRLMDKGHIFASAFTNNGVTSYKEGQRDFVLANVLDVVIEADPFKFLDVALRIKQERGRLC